MSKRFKAASCKYNPILPLRGETVKEARLFTAAVFQTVQKTGNNPRARGYGMGKCMVGQ